MTEQDRPEPVTETRGGKKVDWAKVKPGEPVPDLEEKDPAEPGQTGARLTYRPGHRGGNPGWSKDPIEPEPAA